MFFRHPLLAVLSALIAGDTFGPSLSTAQHPIGATCDDLPGFCHRRSSRDQEHIRQWKDNNGVGRGGGTRGGGRGLADVQPPPGYVPFSPGEYDPVEGILLAFDGSSSGGSTYDMDVVAGIAAAVTNQVTPTKVFMVANANQKPVAQTFFSNAGVDMSKVEWIQETIDAVWIRDYGPRYICDPIGDVRAAVDTKYYSSRPNDDTLPTKLGNGNVVGPYNNYDLNAEIMHSGGNGHFFSTRAAFSSELLLRDNGETEEQLKTYWADYKGADLHLFPKLSFSVDGTGHIDMWMLPVSDTAVIIGQWAQEDQYGSKAITDDAAAYMAARGYTVYRTPNWNSKQKVYGYSIHYTYTNAVIANDVVVISSFGAASEGRDAIAKAVYETAFPGKTIVQVDSSEIIKRSGALHCIAQHVYDCAQATVGTTTTVATTPTTSGATTTTTAGSCSGPAGCQVGGSCSGGCTECCCGSISLGKGAKQCNS